MRSGGTRLGTTRLDPTGPDGVDDRNNSPKCNKAETLKINPLLLH